MTRSAGPTPRKRLRRQGPGGVGKTRLAAVAELRGALLNAADDLTVLATSREPVGLAGETRFRLAPLPVSGPVASAGAGAPAAVALFADRA
jgi:predicted ATPase